MVAVAAIRRPTVVDLEYRADQALLDKDFRAGRVYASTMTAKIHTMVVVVAARVVQG
jgi:hypothetical protein